MPFRDLGCPAAGPLVSKADSRYIYLACPWAPVGGGMFRVADYLIQCQSDHQLDGAAQLRPLDTRGASGPLFSLWVLLSAMLKIAKGRISGGLAGVHINMAERMSLFRKGTMIVGCAAIGVPTVLHLHAQMRGFYDHLPTVLKRLTRWIFSLPNGVIVIGPAARTFVIDTLQVPAIRVRMITNGVPGPGVEVARTAKRDRQRLLFIGNLSDKKGLMDLLRALAQPELDRSRLEVTIAGGGNLAGYRARSRVLGVDDTVHFTGWCDQKKISQLLGDCDVLILPSHDEVLPLAILEALAHGVAVVTTPVGEIPSLLTDGVDSLFVTVGSPVSIAAAINRILAETDLRQSLEKNGRATYRRHFCLSDFFSNVAIEHQRHFGVAGQLKEALVMAHRYDQPDDLTPVPAVMK